MNQMESLRTLPKAEPINLPAEDAGLISRLDQFNAEADEHWQRMQSGGVDIDDAELMGFSIDDLHDLAAGQFAAGLKLRQQAVKLTDLRKELLEELEPELTRSIVEAERAEADTIKRVEKALIKAGQGPENQLGGKHGNTLAAQRQFQHLVMTSQPVQEIRLQVKQVKNAHSRHLNELQRTEEMRDHAVSLLRSYVLESLATKGF
jgi:hypothetical protein